MYKMFCKMQNVYSNLGKKNFSVKALIFTIFFYQVSKQKMKNSSRCNKFKINLFIPVS